MRRGILPPCLCLLALGVSSCSGGEDPVPAVPSIDMPAGLFADGDSRDLILVAIDTLRVDRLPFYGAERATGGDPETPFSLSWLARNGTLFEQVWAPAGRTMPSFSSLWTGLEPAEHGAVNNLDRVLAPTFAMDLAERGWSGHSAVSNFILRKGTGLQRGFADYAMHRKEDEPNGPAELLTRTAADIAAGKRMFVWGHYMAPHQPYAPAPEHLGTYSSADGVAGIKTTLQILHRDPSRHTEVISEQLHALYDEEILTAGDYVTELLTGLDRQYREADRGGLLQNAVVVFLSDHGEGLGDHSGYYMHAKSLYSGVIQVPLMILGEGWEPGRRESRAVALAEVFPMVLSGESPSREYFVASFGFGFYSIRDQRWTLVHNPEDDPLGPSAPPQDAAFHYPVVGLYDRLADPLEQRNVAADNPEVTRRLLDALNDWYTGLEPPYGEEGVEMSPDEMQTIGEVGYATDDLEGAGGIPWRGAQWNP
ncbi:MAG: sulfatase-like hydrolase/transferase [Planctomycetota bacterium]